MFSIEVGKGLEFDQLDSLVGTRILAFGSKRIQGEAIMEQEPNSIPASNLSGTSRVDRHAIMSIASLKRAEG